MQTVAFTLNGKPTRITTDESRPLLWVLRDDLGLTGTKFGCGQAVCGACTVVIGSDAVRACATTVGEVQGKSVTTIEGLAKDGRLHPLQDAFVKHAAFQCGFCTSGMIMGAYARLLKNPKTAPALVLEELEAHLCRCGAHVRIVDAVTEAAAAMKGGVR
jgi:carbon-monoxide dehydrogenase small subunit